MYWRRIRIPDGLSSEVINDAKEAAKNHPKGVIAKMPYTEKDYEWVILYDHIRSGQITPWAMRNMRRKDLYFLAGLSFPHPALLKPDKDIAQNYINYKNSMLLSLGWGDEEIRWSQLTKIQGNAIRAQEEIRYRNFFWATVFVVLAAIIGSFSAWMLSTVFSAQI